MEGDKTTAEVPRNESSERLEAGETAGKEEPSLAEPDRDVSEKPAVVKDKEKKMKPDLIAERRITGRCLCKLSIVVYLVGCVLISAMYVALYGPAQSKHKAGEAWIPGKVDVHYYACTCIIKLC